MKTLIDMPNISKVIADDLTAIGITTSQQLIELGSEKALLKLAGRSVCISKLYALEGAVKDVRWHDLDDERKKQLKETYNTIK